MRQHLFVRNYCSVQVSGNFNLCETAFVEDKEQYISMVTFSVYANAFY